MASIEAPHDDTPQPKMRRRRPDGSPKIRVTPGFAVTGVRISPRLSPTLMELARHFGSKNEAATCGRPASLTSIACHAMLSFARKHGVALQYPGDVSESRRDDEDLALADHRRLWIKYPESWRAGLEELHAACPNVETLADLWRSAIFEFAVDSGLAQKAVERRGVILVTQLCDRTMLARLASTAGIDAKDLYLSIVVDMAKGAPEAKLATEIERERPCMVVVFGAALATELLGSSRLGRAPLGAWQTWCGVPMLMTHAVDDARASVTARNEILAALKIAAVQTQHGRSAADAA